MKRIIIASLLLTLLSAAYGFGQSADSTRQINELRRQMQAVRAENEKLRSNFSETNQKIETQRRQIEELQNEFGKAKESLEQKTSSISEKLETNDASANQKISDLSLSLNRNTIIWLVVLLVVVIITFLLFRWLRRRQKVEKSDLETAISANRQSQEEAAIRFDNKLTEVLALQLNNVKPEDTEIDHSLALKIANEMNRMRMNIINMNPETRGLKQLNRALNNMIESLQGKGYEIIDLLDKSYEPEMNLLATMEPDENLKIGEEKIKRIVKPQINFNGKIVQTGEVVVGYGE